MRHDSGPDAGISIEFAQQIDLAGSLAPLGRWGDDLMDRWDGAWLARTARLARGQVVAYVARLADDGARPRLDLHLAPDAKPFAAEMVSHLRATLLTDASALDALVGVDTRVAGLATRYPGVVPILFRDPFGALVRSISAQQVNLGWATTVRRRLAERYGTRYEVAGRQVRRLEPASLERASMDELRALQLTMAKARSVIACAQAAVAGLLDEAALESMGDEDLVARLTTLPGIGRWSAEWFLARTLGRPRVVAGDLGVRKAIGRLYGTAALPSEQEVRRLTAHWGAAAAHVQALALHELAVAAPRPVARPPRSR